MVGLWFAVIVSIGIPIGFLLYAFIKKQLRAYIFGVLAFVISQLLFRIPILQVLDANSLRFTMFSATKPVLFAILLAFSAGLVEEIARFLFIRYGLKNRSWQTGVVFGAGHGGIEAIIFVGMTAVALLFATGGAAYGSDFFIGGLERLFTIILHIGLSLLVLRSVRERTYSFLFGAIAIHTVVNALVGIVPLFFTPTVAIALAEVSLAIVAFGLLSYHLMYKRKGVFQ